MARCQDKTSKGTKRFMGNLIFKELEEAEIEKYKLQRQDFQSFPFKFLEIVDGQQRITTVAILLSVIGHQLMALSEKNIHMRNRSMFRLRLGEKGRHYPLITNTRDDMTKVLQTILVYGTENKEQFQKEIPGLDLSGPTPVPNNDNNEVFDMSNEQVRVLRTGDEASRNLAAKERLMRAYKFFKEKVEGLRTQSRESNDYKQVLKDLDSLIITGFRFTQYIQNENVNVIETFMSINDRAKSLNALENTKSLLISFSDKMPPNDPEYDIVPKIQSLWDFIYDLLADSKLVGDHHEEKFLACVWRAFYTGSLTSTNLFSDIRDTFSKELQKLLPVTQDTAKKGQGNVDLNEYSRESDDENEDDEDDVDDDYMFQQQPAKRPRLRSDTRKGMETPGDTEAVEMGEKDSNNTSNEVTYDNTQLGGYILAFLNFLRHTIPMFCWLNGTLHTSLLFGDKYTKKLDLTLGLLRLGPFFENAVPLIMAAHFACIFHEHTTYRYTQERYARDFYRFLKLIRYHLLFWSISVNTDTGHLDNYANMLYHTKRETDDEKVTFASIYHEIANELKLKPDKLRNFVGQRYEKGSHKKSKTSKAMGVVVLEDLMKKKTKPRNIDEKLKILNKCSASLLKAKRLGFIHKCNTLSNYYSIGNRYIVGSGYSPKSFGQIEGVDKRSLKEQINGREVAMIERLSEKLKQLKEFEGIPQVGTDDEDE